jgi:predicted PurR-regulated permease PerM
VKQIELLFYYREIMHLCQIVSHGISPVSSTSFRCYEIYNYSAALAKASKPSQGFYPKGPVKTDMIKLNSKNKTFFYLLLLFTIYVAYNLLRPYLGTIVFTMVIVVIFRPVYRRYLKWVRKRQGLAIALTIITIFVVMLIPLTLIIQITVDQAIALSKDIAALNVGKDNSISYVIAKGNEFLQAIPFDHGYVLTEQDAITTLKNVATPVGSFLAGRAIGIGSSTVDIITTIIIFLSLLSAVLPTWPRVIQFFKDLSPLDDELDQKYIDRVTAMTQSMVRGIFVVAVAQGSAMGMFLWIAGVPYTAFWVLLSIFLSILPVGASLVALPIGIILLLTGNIWQGLLVILGYVLVVANIDSLLRPRLVPKETELSPALILLSLFGGIKLFGFMGVVYGPVVMIFLMTTVEIYMEHYKLSSQVEG